DTAPPGAEHEVPVSVCGPYGEHPARPSGQRGGHLAGAVARHGTPVRCRGGEEGHVVRGVEQVAVVVAEDRYAGGVDDPVAVEIVAAGPVVGVEPWRGGEAAIQPGRPGDVLLLRPGPGTESAARVLRGGEYERGHRTVTG